MSNNEEATFDPKAVRMLIEAARKLVAETWTNPDGLMITDKTDVFCLEMALQNIEATRIAAYRSKLIDEYLRGNTHCVGIKTQLDDDE